jgi:diguanylate cyclase (GGDEF)-like protein
METTVPSADRRSGAGVTTRLIALVMLPLTAMCLLAGSVVFSHRSLAARAVAVDEGVTELSDLVAVRDALLVQQATAAFDVRFEELGVTRALASEFIGFDLTGRIAPARAAADRAIATLGPRSPVTASELAALYVAIDEGDIGPALAVERLGDFFDTVAGVLSREFDRLDAEARQAPLVAALRSLRVTAGLVDEASQQGIDLSAIWFPPLTQTQQEAAAALAHFGEASADYAASVVELRELGVASVTTSLERIEADPQFQAFDQAVDEGLLGLSPTETGAQIDTAKIAATFRGFLARDALLAGLLTTATVAVRDEARRLAAAERTTFMTWALGTAALSFASIGVALWLARSISKPLKDLADYAQAVNEGELEAEPAPSRNHGPRETRLAFGVFADLVANLQLLDAKANALAHCDFDDPVLRAPLPGRLGQSLESSVALLSGSIVERDQLQTHLAHQATHDSLTGISNRPAAITAIQAAMHRAARTGATTAALFVDLNDFKAVNDRHGHEVGDEVLRQIASRMTVDLRSGDFVARLGGDEFVVVAEGIVDVADATDLARRIIETVSVPMNVGVLQISIGAAVGVALTLDGPEEPLRLLARADAAMYRAKQHEGSAIEIFDADLQQQMIERVDIETALAAALTDLSGGGLRLHYQPVLDAASGALAGVEALIRWDRPGKGMLMPDSFIPIAEATALIIDLDCWVLAEATRQLVAWSSVAELSAVPVAVNISGRHLLSRKLPDHIRAVLAQTGIDPRRLSIEITETVLLTDLVAAAAELDAVRALGVKVAIDDFGTGYTSLAHLQQLPIDTIKIDRLFISQLNVRRGSSLVRMVTDLGHAIDINIVAEGVETQEEMSALQAMGADHLQGYLLSRPLTPAALSAWAHERVAVSDTAE